MGHIDYNKKTRSGSTPPEWLKVGASVGALTNYFAGRGDIAACVSTTTSSGAPACFAPATAEVEVATDLAFGKGTQPDMIGDLLERGEQFKFPRATGLIFHEAMHARFSVWDIQKAAETLTPKEFESLILLEEGRIESLGLNIYPDNACFLRACVLDLVMRDLDEEPLMDSPTRAAAKILLLTSARVDAGSIKGSDVVAIEEVITKKISLDLFDKLRQLWVQAQATTNIEELYVIAREWSRLVDEAAAEAGEQDDEEGGYGASGGTGGTGSEIVDEIMEALRDAVDESTIGANDDLADQQTTEEWRDTVSSRSTQASRAREHRTVSGDVFGKGTGPVADIHTSSRLIEERAARPDERAAAVKLAALLERAKYRDRDETEIHSIVPPGRLRTRAMVQGAALKSKGVMTQVEPWRRTVRKHTDDPTLTIGVMVDISGSMSDAMEPMAVSAWILSEAVRRVQGRAAMIYYGQGVFPVLKPGQHLDKVTVYSAADGTEKFDKAFKALDGSLDLLTGEGARMLVVVSDGCYTGGETSAAKKWVNECVRAGVAVTWIDFDYSGREAQRILNGTPAGYVHARSTGTSATALSESIGKVAAQALTGTARAQAR